MKEQTGTKPDRSWRLDWDDETGGDVITNGEQSVSLYDAHHSVRAMVQAALNMVDEAERAARRAREQFAVVCLYAYADTKEREREGWTKRDSEYKTASEEE